MSVRESCKKFVTYNFPVVGIFVMYFVIYNIFTTVGTHTIHESEQKESLTIRVNTYRRLDLLENFMEYYAKCDIVNQVQIVWSDQEEKPPMEWLKKYSKDKFIYEVHSNNSLSNRFRALIPVPTEAVLSIDDDLIIPCIDLHHSLQVWKSNKRALVGYSPRMHANDVETGKLRYLNWQYTWWSGVYSIMLTKAAILHRDYLADYDKLVPPAMLRHIDTHRNCEDIAMAYVVAKKSNAAPVWMKATIYETSTGGISSNGSHFIDRGECIAQLRSLTGGDWPWVHGYQKVLPFSFLSDWGRLWYDTK